MTGLAGMGRRPPWLLASCSVALAALLGIEWMAWGGAPPTALPGLNGVAPAAGAAVSANAVPPPRQSFAVIAERPLFVPDRRPQADQAAAPVLSLPALVVEGVVLTQGRSYAVVRHGAPPRLETVTQGASVEGWTVKDINARRIVLQSAARMVEFDVTEPGENSAAGRDEPAKARPHD